MKKVTASEAVSHIHSDQHIFIHSAAAAPAALIQALYERKDELRNVKIYSIHTEGAAPYANPECSEAFKVQPFFVGHNVRAAVNEGRGSYIPVFLSEVPGMFRKKMIPLDVALISVSPPDQHGFCSMGPSVDISWAAQESAKMVIAQVNDYMPRTYGDGVIHMDDIDLFVDHTEPLPEMKEGDISKEEQAIGNYISELVEDGATLQMGIGAIPNAVMKCLTNHKNLGIHSEMISDGILPLIEKGVVNGKNKIKNHRMIVSSFAVGTSKLYKFMDNNPQLKMLDFAYVNNPSVILKNPKMTAINSAIEIDLTGQVCADSIGPYIYSGVGGQMDFIRGASLSEGGKPIIAMSATTKDGKSKIVPMLKPGAGVVTTRAHVHYVVTEFGVANLYGKSLEERARLLIGLAHPDHRETLEIQYAQNFKTIL